MKDSRRDDQLNRIIAEWTGWKRICDWSDPFSGRFGLYGYPPFERTEEKPVPNYCQDLNSIHEAEKRIVDWVAYRIQLSHAVGIGYAPDLDICEDIKSFLSASARQRAEALVSVIQGTQL